MWQARLLSLTIGTLLVITISGCGSDAERVAQVALEGAKRQAALDQEMAHLSQEVTQTNRSMMESQSRSHEQMLALVNDVENQRQQVDQERRNVAILRARESVLAPVLLTVGTLAVCGLPLALCYYLLKGLSRESAEAPVTQLLVEQLMLVEDPLGLRGASDAPLLPGSRPAIGLTADAGRFES